MPLRHAAAGPTGSLLSDRSAPQSGRNLIACDRPAGLAIQPLTRPAVNRPKIATSRPAADSNSPGEAPGALQWGSTSDTLAESPPVKGSGNGYTSRLW